MRSILFLLAGALLSACATTPATPPAAAAAEARAPVTILIAIDGARPDYIERGVTPNLSALARAGITAPMHPSFPSKTFPNHWTLVTGMRPDRHGIVANRMEDAARPGEVFTMASDDPFWWNAAEPIWVATERAGIRTATMFWPGSNVAWGASRGAQWPHALTGGARPADWQQFNQEVTGEQRVQALLDWMRRPADIRPRFVTLYFDTVDTAGHRFGPDAPETTRAVAEVDALIGRLRDGLAALGQPANLVITSDHGMAATSSDRAIALDRIAAASDYRIVENGPYAALEAMPGRERALEAALLRPHPHMQCWRKRDIPARLHYGRNPRVPGYLCLAEVGWTIEKTAPDRPRAGGSHGYDDTAPEMAALFIASGPAIRPGAPLGAFANVEVYPLLRRLLAMPPKPGIDGTGAVFDAAVAP